MRAADSWSPHRCKALSSKETTGTGPSTSTNDKKNTARAARHNAGVSAPTTRSENATNAAIESHSGTKKPYCARIFVRIALRAPVSSACADA